MLQKWEDGEEKQSIEDRNDAKKLTMSIKINFVREYWTATKALKSLHYKNSI